MTLEGNGQPKDPPFVFRLFMDGTSDRCWRARANLDRLCRRYLHMGQYRIEQVDMRLFPEEADKAMIIAAPTLVIEGPGNLHTHVLGDLSKAESVFLGLERRYADSDEVRDAFAMREDSAKMRNAVHAMRERVQEIREDMDEQDEETDEPER